MTGHKLLGRWEYERLPSLSYNFLPSGVGFYTFGDAKKEFEYTVTDSEIKIHFIGDFMPSVFKYSIAEDTLLIDDSFGNTVKYKKQGEKA